MWEQSLKTVSISQPQGSSAYQLDTLPQANPAHVQCSLASHAVQASFFRDKYFFVVQPLLLIVMFDVRQGDVVWFLKKLSNLLMFVFFCSLLLLLSVFCFVFVVVIF